MDDRLKAPLKLFVAELSTHLEFLRQNSSSFPEHEPAQESLRKKLESKFHLIKGSAGFFSLTEIVRLAGRGERAIKDSKGNSSALRRFFDEELTSIVEELGREFQRLTDE
jgi:chemotaxis protein histidine kinase CheA